VAEFQVEPDRRTAWTGPNPARTLAVRESSRLPGGTTLHAAYGGLHYWIQDTRWDRQAFTLLYQLFQMTMADLSRVGAPAITIGK
jgi:hypothetical protein